VQYHHGICFAQTVWLRTCGVKLDAPCCVHKSVCMIARP
jgi:hypothetical protein